VHEFVLMPNHFHLLLTVPPGTAIERAVQLVKGKSAYRLSHELGWKTQVWQRGFTDHQITDPEDYIQHREYIHQNPVKRGLAASAEQYRFCSAYPGYRLDPRASSAAKAGCLWLLRHEWNSCPYSGSA
jgi:putative transposase